jgi:hypothetical protein
MYLWSSGARHSPSKSLDLEGTIAMATKRAVAKKHVQYHKDGSIWAKGQAVDGAPTGYWEWFQKDGTIMRSGHFDKGEQVFRPPRCRFDSASPDA